MALSFDSYTPTGSGVTNLHAMRAWAYAVSLTAGSGGAVQTDDAHGLARATNVPASSPLGRWMRRISTVAEAGGSGGNGLLDALKAAQIQLGSPFGKWAARLSSAMS
jgi:hypothetical protein